MTTTEASKQEQTIEKARLILKPSPVRLHHMPRWFIAGVRRSHGRLLYNSAITTLENGPYCRTTHWLDHWGSTDYHGKQCFVSEPYNLSAEAIKAISDFCRDAGFCWEILSNSWWYPGSTLRLLIYRREDGKPPLLG